MQINIFRDLTYSVVLFDTFELWFLKVFFSFLAVVIYDAISDGGIWTNRFLDTSGKLLVKVQLIGFDQQRRSVVDLA